MIWLNRDARGLTNTVHSCSLSHSDSRGIVNTLETSPRAQAQTQEPEIERGVHLAWKLWPQTTSKHPCLCIRTHTHTRSFALWLLSCAIKYYKCVCVYVCVESHNYKHDYDLWHTPHRPRALILPTAADAVVPQNMLHPLLHRTVPAIWVSAWLWVLGLCTTIASQW